MRSLARTVGVVCVASALFATACRSAEDVARDPLRARLKQEGRLTPQELQQLFEAVGPAIANRSVTVRQGAVVRELTTDQRIELLDILADPMAVYDAGIKSEAGATWRGITGGATPTMSEIDAMETLWIDVTTFVPKRYEFAYSTPGLGDFAYDLSFE